MANNQLNNRHSVLKVDRAIADLRRGAVINITHEDETWLIASPEAASPSIFEEIASITSHRPALAITAERADALRLTQGEASPLTLLLPATAPWEEIQALAFSCLNDAPTPPVLTGVEITESNYPTAAALQLAKFARLLPAVLIAPAVAEAASLTPALHSTTPLATIAAVTTDDVMSYPKRLARSLKPISEAQVPLAGIGMSRFVLFRAVDGSTEHLAVIVGAPPVDRPVLVRVHSACLTGDIFNSLKCDCGDQLRGTVKTMAQSEGGVLLYLTQEGRGIGLANKLRAYQLQALGYDTVDANQMLGFEHDERRYEAAAEMLRQLHIRQVCLMTNNPKKLQALDMEGIEITGRVPVIGTVNPHNEGYLSTKAKRAGHLFGVGLKAAVGGSK